MFHEFMYEFGCTKVPDACDRACLCRLRLGHPGRTTITLTPPPPLSLALSANHDPSKAGRRCASSRNI